MDGEPPICFRSASERSGRSADGLGWPRVDWLLSGRLGESRPFRNSLPVTRADPMWNSCPGCRGSLRAVFIRTDCTVILPFSCCSLAVSPLFCFGILFRMLAPPTLKLDVSSEHLPTNSISLQIRP
jgi:hypothetical protein